MLFQKKGAIVLANKYYAVKKGREPGIYQTWDECKAMVHGYPGAVFKSFTSQEEAEAFLGKQIVQPLSTTTFKAYVDGSFLGQTNQAGYGVVLLEGNKEMYFNGVVPDHGHRNVAGEMAGALKAVEETLRLGHTELSLYYDYEGIEKWATGEWKANLESTKQYQDTMQTYLKEIDIHFHKVAAHTGDYYNEMADRLAKEAAGSAVPKKSSITLSKEQEEALNYLNKGHHVFLTGKAGTGKSYVLKAFIEQCEKKLLVLAPTGIAALQVGGVTLHRAFEAKVGPIITSPKRNIPEVVEEAEVIIIDEISMCRIDLFDFCMKTIERSHTPKQIILVGDFYQLPPVMPSQDLEILKKVYPDVVEGYAFESEYFKKFNFKTIELTQVMRQTENDFVEHLNQIREGNTQGLAYFNQYIRPPRQEAIIVSALNRNVDAINDAKLEALPGKAYTYEATIEGQVNKGDYPTAPTLTLKKGCRVMALVNDSEQFQYQNGSMGTVVKLTKQKVVVQLDQGSQVEMAPYEWSIENYEVVDVVKDGKKQRRLEKEKIGAFKQFPLRLAYAITIHKSQGQTYDYCHLEPYCFSPGQLYVALSRCRSMEGFSLEGPIYPKYLKISEKVKMFYAEVTRQ